MTWSMNDYDHDDDATTKRRSCGVAARIQHLKAPR